MNAQEQLRLWQHINEYAEERAEVERQRMVLAQLVRERDELAEQIRSMYCETCRRLIHNESTCEC